MSNNAEVIFAGSAAGLLKEYDKLRKAADDQEKDMKRNVQSQREAAREERKRLTDAHKLTEQNMNAQEKYNRRISQLNDHLKAGRISQQTFNREVATQNDLLRKSTDRGGEAVRTIGKFAAAITGVGSVIGGIAATAAILRRELENMRERQGQAKETQLEVADAEREALLNLGVTEEEDAARLRAHVEKISQATGARRAGVFKAMSTALSFKGADLGEEAAVDAVMIGAQISPRNMDEATVIAQGILAQQKKGGGTAEEVAGQQLAIKRTSPVAASDRFSRNIAPAIANLTSFGDSTREGGALLATLGQGMGDSSGEMTGTAAIQLAKQLAVAVPQGSSTLERMEMVRRDDKLRQAFLGTLDEDQRSALKAGERGEAGELTGEAKAFMTFVELLSKENNKTQETLRASLQAIPELKDAAKEFTGQIGMINKVTLQQTANAENVIQGTAEGLRLADTKGARAAIGREGLSDILKAAGVSATDQFFEEVGFELNAGIVEDQPIDYVAKRIRARERVLRAPRAPATSAGPAQPTPIPASASNVELANKLGEVAAALEKVTASLHQNTEATKEDTKAVKGANGPAPQSPLMQNDRSNRMNRGM